jgi:hypothetical protein
MWVLSQNIRLLDEFCLGGYFIVRILLRAVGGEYDASGGWQEKV